ncbi:MAG: calcium-binding protein, partial [Sphingorhabdus sp.]
ASNANDAVLDYLTDWNEILWQVYPDYAPTGAGNLLGAAAPIDQAFIMQMLIPAFEARGWTFDPSTGEGTGLDIRGVAHALSVNEERIITHGAEALSVGGTAGSDYFYMTGGPSTGSGSSEQTYSGGNGADYYFVGGNSGNDVIRDQDTGGDDELRFTAVDSQHVKARRDGQDLVLEVRAPSTGSGLGELLNTVRLTDQFLGELNPTVLKGTQRVQAESGVNQIVFSDGVIWDRFRMAMQVADPRDTRDKYVGSGSGDVLWGGKENDILEGGAGGDIYIFQRGDGSDVISERGSFALGPVKAGLDFLSFRGDISADDLHLRRDGNGTTLYITILDKQGNPTSDTIEIEDYFGGISLGLGAFGGLLGSSDGLDYVSPNLIERFIFDDGTSLEFTQIAERVLANAKTVGDDAIYGFISENTLDGGAGNDTLIGGKSDDTYIFGRGYGQDVIEDNGPAHGLFDPPQNDVLKFIDDIRWTDLDYLRTGKSDTLTLRVKGSNDQVTLRDFLEAIPFIGYVNAIETVQFGDGTKWSYLQLLQRFVDVAETAGNDIVYGFEGIADTFRGGAGNDRLEGLTGGDTYYFAAGSGNDTVFDTGGSDRIIFSKLNLADVKISRTALDLVFTIKTIDAETGEETYERLIVEGQYIRDGAQYAAVEIFEFRDQEIYFTDLNPEDIALDHVTGGATNGADIITGSNFGEIIDGRAGDDQMIGGDGGDTYIWDVGYGKDVIEDKQVRAHWGDRKGARVAVDDVIEFGADIRYKNDKNIKFTPVGTNGWDLLITVDGRPDSTLIIRNQFKDIDSGIETFRFADGTILNAGNIELEAKVSNANRGNNDIFAPEPLDGKQGNDKLHGGSGADTYTFTTGYDFDTIFEKANQPGVIDEIIFGASVKRENLIVTRNGDDLVIDLGNAKDVVTIIGGLASTGIEEFHFADGTALTLSDLIDTMLVGGESDDRLVGFDNRNDMIAGDRGSDSLEGGTGDDSYKFGIGDGYDSVSDTGGVDKILFGAGVTKEEVRFDNIDGDLVISLSTGTDKLAILGGYKTRPVESFVFADGQTLSLSEVRGIILSQAPNSGQDRIDIRELESDAIVAPGQGNDRVLMANDATMVFNSGDGIDRIEMPSGVTTATVELPDFGIADAVFRPLARDSADIAIIFPATGDQLILMGAMQGGAVPLLQFADGQTVDANSLAQRIVDGQASDSDDLIIGSQLAQTITPGAGNDYAHGSGGNDTYIFSRGDGQDVIEDANGADDVLRIKGYARADLQVSFSPDLSETEIRFVGSDDRIALRHSVSGSNIVHAVDRIRFDDESTLSLADLLASWRGQGSDRNEHLTGTAAGEIFVPGKGDDVIVGNGGADVIRFNRGDGHDRIESNGTADGLAIVEFGAQILLEDVSAKRDSDGNIILTIAGGDDRLTLVDPVSDSDGIIAALKFADGRQWKLTDITLSILETDGDDHIVIPANATNAGGGSGVEAFGGAGNDWIETGKGNDIVTGGKGNDLLEGNSGADTYYFARGDGQDVIFDVEESLPGNVDKLRFGPGIRPEDIRFLVVGPVDLVIGIAGGDDRLTIRNFFVSAGSGRDYAVESFVFADGASWSLADIYANAAKGGNGADSIDFGTALDIPASFVGGTGDDELAGGLGDTVYLFNRGDGRDIIRESSSSASIDTLRFGAGIVAANVVVTQDGADLVIRFIGSQDQITLAGQASAAHAPINKVEFADGSSWTSAQLTARIVSGDAAERLLYPIAANANPFADPIFQTQGGGQSIDGIAVDAAKAPQTFPGTAGRDVYRLFVPLHADGTSTTVISSFQTGDTGDVLDIRLAAGLPGSLATRQQGTDTLVYFVPDKTQAENFGPPRLLARLTSVSATALTSGNFNGAPFVSGNDRTVNGDAAANILISGMGNDQLEGQGGNDVYRFGRGDGQDAIWDGVPGYWGQFEDGG